MYSGWYFRFTMSSFTAIVDVYTTRKRVYMFIRVCTIYEVYNATFDLTCSRMFNMYSC